MNMSPGIETQYRSFKVYTELKVKPGNLDAILKQLLAWFRKGHVWDCTYSDWGGYAEPDRLPVQPSLMELLCWLLWCRGRVKRWNNGGGDCYCSPELWEEMVLEDMYNEDWEVDIRNHTADGRVLRR